MRKRLQKNLRSGNIFEKNSTQLFYFQDITEILFYTFSILIQRPERKVALCATGFFVIKTIQPHIRFFDFFRTVVKLIEGVHFGRDGYFHFRRENRVVGALDALRGYFKYSGHNGEVFVLTQAFNIFLSSMFSSTFIC